jgi:hypothetical protein
VRPVMHRLLIPQRSGLAYAEIIAVDPTPDAAVSESTVSKRAETVTIATGDAAFEKQLEGFHQIENGWRWTKKEFGITLAMPSAPSPLAARLKMTLYIPESSIQRLGAITLTAKIGEHSLPPETYRQAGQYVFMRDIDGEFLKGQTLTFRFALDKALPPNAGDSRELGIIVSNASLESQ